MKRHFQSLGRISQQDSCYQKFLNFAACSLAKKQKNLVFYIENIVRNGGDEKQKKKKI
jgi:hypothetical protein